MKYKIQLSPPNSRTPKEIYPPVVIRLLLMSFPYRGLTWKTCHPSFTKPAWRSRTAYKWRTKRKNKKIFYKGGQFI